MVGKRLPPLKRRDVVAILEHNGFVPLPRTGTSHVRYRGTIQGHIRTCTVDESVDEFVNKSRTVLYWLVKTELLIEIKDFYAGHPEIAKRAQLKYHRFGD